MSLSRSTIIITSLLFSLTVILWLKTLIDFINYYYQINSLLLFLLWLGFFVYIYIYIRMLILVVKKSFGSLNLEEDKWMWLFIPLSVICTAPVCYSNTIFIAPYPASTIIRLINLVSPFLIFLNKSLETKHKIFLLQFLGFISIIPNDKCFNMFNYSWIEILGASPLTYLPTVITIIFYTLFRYKYLEKTQALIILSIISFGALTLALGHRLKFLW